MQNGKLVKDIIELFRIRVKLANSERPGKVIQYKWVTVKGAYGVSKAKEMAVNMAHDFWPCGGTLYWEADIAQVAKRKVINKKKRGK